MIDRPGDVALRTIEVDEGIALGQFLKYGGVVGTGGHAKVLIDEGEVAVNGDVERRRGRKLRAGDIVTVAGDEFVVAKRGIAGVESGG
ncbi:MAG: RNA-binding S4 domain-containing protein [Thermoleophilia bacterium]